MKNQVEDFAQQAYELCDECRVASDTFKSLTQEHYKVEFLDINQEEVEAIKKIAPEMAFLNYDEDSRHLTVTIIFCP